MLTLERGKTNDNIILTLTEKCTLTSPHFLFELKNDETDAFFYFIAADTSVFPERYNKFSIIEKSSPNPLNGEVELRYDGFYHYTVYEQASATNLDPANTTGIVEIGKCHVLPAASIDTEFDYTPTSKIFNG